MFFVFIAVSTDLPPYPSRGQLWVSAFMGFTSQLLDLDALDAFARCQNENLAEIPEQEPQNPLRHSQLPALQHVLLISVPVSNIDPYSMFDLHGDTSLS